MSSDKTILEGLRIERATVTPLGRPAWLVPAMVGTLALAGAVVWWMTRSAVPVVQTVMAQSQAAVGGGAARTLLNASGYVTARRQATVSSKVTGKVVEVFVEEGKKMEAGQVLARLDATNVEASLRLSEAQLESVRRTLEEERPHVDFAKQEAERFSGLMKSHAASQSDVNRAESEANFQEAKLARLAADVDVADRQVATWRQQLEDTVIHAPFSGIVTTKNAQPGEMISPMSVGGFTRTGICTLVDMSSLEIEVDVNESYINRVQAGLPVEATLDSYPDWRIPAKVIAIIPTADRQKATVKVRVGFEKLDPRILPDMGVKVAFQSPDTPRGAPAGGMVLVPTGAVHQAEGHDIVWVFRDGRLERRAVTVAQTSGDESTIAAGLNHGEKVVVNAPAGLEDGQRAKDKKS
ncbi:MAG TPA: efflux RND transporter periplasmic adaptor subunit [Verrucomicrobiaceae bacterium]